MYQKRIARDLILCCLHFNVGFIQLVIVFVDFYYSFVNKCESEYYSFYEGLVFSFLE